MWYEKSLPNLAKLSFCFIFLSVLISVVSPNGLASTYHTIQAGDCLWSIAHRYQVSDFYSTKSSRNRENNPKSIQSNYDSNL